VVERSETFFRKYGDAAVFLARFLPPVRAFVPITAGALGMAPSRFFPINIVAILCWAPAHIVPGMLAGEVYGHAGAFAGHLAMPIIAGIVAAGFLVWAIRRWMRPSEVG
jgi:membrane-associated protein